MTNFQWVMLSSALTALIIIPAMFWNNRRGRRRENQDMMRTMRRIANERSESQAILASLDVGIVAYGSDDRLIATNPVAEELFGLIPDRLTDFLDRFGTENGMRAAYHLGGDEISGDIKLSGRHLRLVCQHHALSGEGSRFGGHVITAQDFTGIMRQEERRKAFVANVSHELKTPLTTMKSYSETLLDWGLDEKDRGAIRTDIQRIYDDSVRMEELIADLLLLSSLDSSGIHLRAFVFDLAKCARQMSDRLAEHAAARDVRIEFYSLTREPALFADRTSVERILSNLIVNAIRYTDQGGQVEIYVGSVVDDVYVKVKDNGIGISQNELDNIFQRFYRVDKTGSRQFGGTGLGLPIALELARMHQGRIEAESELGKGSQFTVFFPSAARLLRATLLDLSRKEKPKEAIRLAAAATLRDWAGGEGGSDGLFDLRTLLEIIDEKVNNSMDITPAN
ncbi:MAG TPA: HAMP domain-containing sensor histidine kinase [Clostridia bacterium]|nr:HAMP domain-containing sensor histidine kinase [Clostridia bacterium]